MSTFLRALLILLSPIVSEAASQYDVPSTNRYPWALYDGIPGGILDRTTIYTNLSPGVTSADIASAVNACPSNEVVFLTEGVYNLSASLALTSKSYKTLRGAGTNKTILNFTAGGITSDQFSFIGAAALSSGFTKGSTSVVFSATPNANIAVGRLMLLDMEDDTNFVFATTGTNRHINFPVRILTVSGTTVTFEPPMPWNLTGFNPKASYQNALVGLQWFGIEDMTITNAGSATATILYVGTQRCWFKNVEFVKTPSDQLNMVDCFQTEIRHCTFKEVNSWPSQADGFGAFFDGGGFWLIEDCIFYKTGDPILLKNGASGGAILYNFFDYTCFAGVDRQLPDINFSHGAHNMMVLAEGNVCAEMQQDAYHGTASHLTIHRNWIHGTNGYSTIVNWKKPIDLLRGSYWCYVVGNVLGDASWTNAASFAYQATGTFNYTDHAIYRLGYPNSGNGSLTEDQVWGDDYPWLVPYPDEDVTNRLVLHANYDYYTHSQIMYSGAETTLSNSLYYSSHPTNAAVIWPPFDPTTPLAAHATNIQAGHRFWYGTNFTAFVSAPVVKYKGRARVGATSLIP